MSIAVYPGSFDPVTYGHMRMGKPYDLVFTTKIVAVLTFLFTGRKKSVFLYTFGIFTAYFDVYEKFTSNNRDKGSRSTSY